MNKTYWFNVAIIFFLGIFASLFPFFHLGLICGFPSVIMNTIMLSIVFRKNLAKNGQNNE